MAHTLQELAQTHYENFPVGSFFIPRKYREPIHLIYAFARVADDIADEGAMSTEERIGTLDEWGEKLRQAVAGNSSDTKCPSDKFFIKLASAIKKHELPMQLFEDLLTAFRKDASNPIYSTFDEVLDYCRYSANPIGRIMLKIFNCSNEETERLSDDICTALQLTNFWQDISVDTRKKRFYIAQDEFREFRFTKADLQAGMHGERFAQLMKHKVAGTKKLFESGKPLIRRVNWMFRFELKLIWHGGMRILEKIEEQNYDTRFVRPKLDRNDKFFIAVRSVKDYRTLPLSVKLFSEH